jgi:hypothetical protein
MVLRIASLIVTDKLLHRGNCRRYNTAFDPLHFSTQKSGIYMEQFIEQTLPDLAHFFCGRALKKKCGEGED